MFEYKVQFDESDHPLARVTRALTERVSSVFGGMLKSNEMSEVLTEIVKVEPNFEITEFLKRVKFDIIPNVMESLCTGELEILKDWCTEAVSEVNFNLNYLKNV